jgi:hypothetical protein
MNQPQLFDNPSKPSPQDIELLRVSDAIRGYVFRFVEGRRRFHGDELEGRVKHDCAAAYKPCTAGSPLRIMRQLVRQGYITVRLVGGRGQSLYEVQDADAH